jgi:hypothetical protein
MNNCQQCNSLARLLVECRDALPAISTVSARLYHIDLTLADRIDAALEPWACHVDGCTHEEHI